MDGKLRNMASLYLMDGEKMLFLYRVGSRVVSDSYIGSAGGHFEKEELNDAKACVLRELHEETGLVENDIENLSLRYVTLRLRDGEIRQNYYFFADLVNKDIALKSNEGGLEWADMEKSLELEMPYTAKYVVEHFLKEGRKNKKLYVGAASESGILFTELEEF